VDLQDLEHMKKNPLWLVISLCAFVFASSSTAFGGESNMGGKPQGPNIILVFLDDAGYADFGTTGSSTPTPTIDSLAENGVQFTQFYVASPVCSASRAALLTGRYPDRFSFENVLFPDATEGLPQEEETLAELLKRQGYSTHIFGKWHLGHAAGALPLSHGFDEYFGIPYSNDMWPYKRDDQAFDPDDEQAYVHDPESSRPPLPLYEGETIVKASVTPSDQKMLTKTFTDRTIDVIETESAQPFFIYLPYSAPHIPIFVRDEIEGRSGGSLYQDLIYEIDLQMARIMKALRDKGIDQDTLVIFTSDNGPWTVWGDHAGSAGDLRGFKMTTFEGGIRVFAAMHWPAGIEKGVTVTSPVMTIDILPTIAEIVGVEPDGEKLDGESFVGLLSGRQPARTEPRALYNYYLGELESVRYGKWKLHLPREVKTVTKVGGSGFRGDYGWDNIGWSLYDLDADPGERVNLIDRHPEVVEKLKKMAAAFSSELEAGKKPMGDYGSGAALFEPLAASAREVGARAAAWQLSHMDNFDYIPLSHREKTSSPRWWMQGAFYVGLARWADTVDDGNAVDQIAAMARGEEYRLGDRLRHADDHVIGQTYLWLYEKTGDQRTYGPTKKAFDQILADKPTNSLQMLRQTDPNYTGSCTDRWCWADALFMAPRTWLMLSNATGESRYFDYADSEFWATTDYLFSKEHGLFFRDSLYFTQKSDNGNPVFWSRGNGWVFAALPLIIESLPSDHPSRPGYLSLYREMAKSLVKLQNPYGYWPASLMDADKVKTPETSGTGFITFGLAWGVNRGLLRDQATITAVEDGWRAIEAAVDEEGFLHWVQQVGAGPDPVKENDTQLYGVGAVLLAASEMTKWKGAGEVD
jgi:arylsulfatase A-like enzyme/rhamnogalacturonyl hydrolase YesR